MEWWLIRHGLTSWNVARKYQGHSDVELLPDEKNGLAALPGKLQGVQFSAIYCSDLLRCRQTLDYIYPDLNSIEAEVYFDHRLREMNFGEWEGKTYEMLKGLPLYTSWIDHPQNYTPPGGESWQQFHDRVHDVYLQLRERSRQVSGRCHNGQEDPRLLIVTHGGVISLLSTFLNAGAHFWDTRPAPGEVIKLQVDILDE
ncbi:Alpha-ribazole phosphatase [compost metagenome]